MALAKHNTTPAIINRRQLFAAAPVLVFLPTAAIAIEPADPVVELCRQYIAADTEVERLGALPGGENYDTPEIEFLCDARAAVYREIAKLVPTTLEGVAAMATVLVANEVGLMETKHYATDDWIKFNMANGARALLA